MESARDPDEAGGEVRFGPYRPLAQVGAGVDGVSYRAEGAEGPVEVRALGRARADAGRWPALARRLRLAALLGHPAALRVHALELDHGTPYIVLDCSETAELPAGREALAMGLDLAGALAAAHRLGLVHGRLGPGRIRARVGGAPALDFTGIDARPTPADEADPAPGASRVPEGRGGSLPDFAGDVHALGVLLGRLSGGSDRPDILDDLLRELTAPDPADRPTAAAARDRLAAILGRAPGPEFADDPGDDAAPSDASIGVIPPAPEEISPREGRGRLRLLERLGSPAPGGPAATAGDEGPAIPGQLGRFRLLERIGRGGMGSVYRAEDLGDGSVVAIKVQDPRHARQPEALRRFRKEARMLAEVNNPYVTNLLEANEDAGIPYLVLEFVDGTTLGRLLAARGPLAERAALAVMADVARALVAAHERGIVHRDVKPENILLLGPAHVEAHVGFLVGEPTADGDGDGAPAVEPPTMDLEAPGVKLSDFGLARRMVEAESQALTQPGRLVGTPLYMAPEQCAGGAIDPRSDVYAMGATLFHMLAGRPPFTATDPIALLAKHRYDAPPAIRSLVPALSDGAGHVVAKALAKDPGDRYADAGALLRDLDALIRGDPIPIDVHPRLPDADPRAVVEYRFRWDLDASPRQLWPLVSDTERLNRAVGLPAVAFSSEAVAGGGPRRVGTFRKLGIRATWEEHPFEWVEGRRLGVLREYSRGPFYWLASVVELAPRPGGGTALTHHVRLLPRGRIGRAIAAVEVGVRGRRALERVYRRIDASLAAAPGERADPAADPFEAPEPLAGARRRRLDARLAALAGRGVGPDLARRLGAFLAGAPPQEVARIRPLALARRWGDDPGSVVAACLLGAGEGLLELLWDLVCPACRIPAGTAGSLRDLREHGHCDACNLDFEHDFANSVELIFRAHPAIRAAEAGVYCVGGPAHSPHVVAQVRVAAGERVELDLALAEGAYRVRGPELPFAPEFRVQPAATAGRWDLALSRGPGPAQPEALRPGAQRLTFLNDGDRELVVRVERVAARDDALTAARASALALFRELFPAEVLAPGQLIRVTHVTILVTELDRARDLYDALGDARAFAAIHEHLRALEEAIRDAGGALIKVVGEGILAAFADPVAAVRVGLDLPCVPSAGPPLRPRAAVHRGPALAVTLNDQLDYFGATVSRATRLLGSARGGELALSPSLAADPEVAALLASRGLEGRLLSPDPQGQAAIVVRAARRE